VIDGVGYIEALADVAHLDGVTVVASGDQA
jgi:hypothetical protein